MNTAKLYSFPIDQHPGYAWKWRASDGTESKRSFTYYFDCLTDAREHGYTVDQVSAVGTAAPGGVRHKLT